MIASLPRAPRLAAFEMTPETKDTKAALLFSRLLSESEQKRLQDARKWRWIASVGNEKIVPTRHPLHENRLRSMKAIYKPAHREVRLMLSGETVYGFNGKVYQVTPGTVLLFNHYEPRGWQRAPYFKNFRMLWLNFQDRRRVNYHTHCRDADGRCFREVLDRTEFVESAARIMDVWDHCTAHARDTMSWALLKALLTGVLLEILATTSPTLSRGHHQKVIDMIQEFIRAHPADDLSLGTLAQMAGYSPFFFHRLFLRHAGLTLRDYVNLVRLEHAKALLLQNYTVEAVAEAIGMTPSYLNRFFKQRMRHSPRQWSRLNMPIVDGG